MKEDVKIQGFVKYWQEENGKIVPGTVHVDHNAIQDALRYFLAQAIGTNTTNALDNLFTKNSNDSAFSFATDASGKDGIAYKPSASDYVQHVFKTTKNAGGTGAESYIEFKGELDAGSSNFTLSGELQFGFNLTGTALGTDTVFTKVYSTYAINTTITANRTFLFYWKITTG